MRPCLNSTIMDTLRWIPNADYKSATETLKWFMQNTPPTGQSGVHPDIAQANIIDPITNKVATGFVEATNFVERIKHESLAVKPVQIRTIWSGVEGKDQANAWIEAQNAKSPKEMLSNGSPVVYASLGSTALGIYLQFRDGTWNLFEKISIEDINRAFSLFLGYAIDRHETDTTRSNTGIPCRESPCNVETMMNSKPNVDGTWCSLCHSFISLEQQRSNAHLNILEYQHSNTTLEHRCQILYSRERVQTTRLSVSYRFGWCS